MHLQHVWQETTDQVFTPHARQRRYLGSEVALQSCSEFGQIIRRGQFPCANNIVHKGAVQ